MKKKMTTDKLELGVCYYPEHWDKSLWADDLRRMMNNGIQTIRIAEFAWSIFEPNEGYYTFELFDDFMETAAKSGIKVIFGTPTATPPVWLTEKYPEVLNCDINEIPYRHGCRRHYNYNSPKYQELSKKIVKKLAEHYGKCPCIIGWQIDNELNCELNEFYSKSDTLAFREFLKVKYKTLDVLNNAWGTVFWNQTYSCWDEVYVPRKTANNSTNPHQVLDYTRFISDSACRFASMQSEILREFIKPGDFITTNGMFSNLDNHRLTSESLDFYMYDSYPNFAYCMIEDPKESKDLNDRKWSRNLTEVRSVSENFGIMEQQSGANGWNTRMEAPAPKPGQMTLWTMQSIAHGADFISYFRWRTCTHGSEIYWHGILDYSNRDNRRLKELREISNKVKKIETVAGAAYQASFAVIKDYDNIWDCQLDQWHQRVDKVSQAGIFQAAQLTHTPMDYVYMTDTTSVKELSRYKVLFYPHATILNQKRVDVLKEYVLQGGCLVMGCRTGYKDMSGKCVMLHLPGLVQNLSGTDVVDYTFVGPADEIQYIDWEGEKLEAAVFNDILAPLAKEAEVLGSYENNYYKGEPGLIKNGYGKGFVYYFGGAFTRKTAMIFLNKLGIVSPYKNLIELPEVCEIAIRKKESSEYIFVLNYSQNAVKIRLKKKLTELYYDNEEFGEVWLQPYETKVYVNKSCL